MMRCMFFRRLLSTVCILLVCTSAFLPAQEADIRQAMKVYGNVRSLTASVVRTKHNVAMAEDVCTNGKLYFKVPGKMCMTFGSGDFLLMENGGYTMSENGRKSVAKGQTLMQFEAMVAVFKEWILGMTDDTSLSEQTEVKVERKGSLCTLTVIPAGATRKRTLFTSFQLALDLKTSTFKWLRMNGRGKNYTLYEFSDFRVDTPVPDKTFDLL